DIKKSALANHLAELKDSNLVEKTHHGTYEISESGKNYIKSIEKTYRENKVIEKKVWEAKQREQLSKSFLERKQKFRKLNLDKIVLSKSYKSFLNPTFALFFTHNFLRIFPHQSQYFNCFLIYGKCGNFILKIGYIQFLNIFFNAHSSPIMRQTFLFLFLRLSYKIIKIVSPTTVIIPFFIPYIMSLCIYPVIILDARKKRISREI
ncbi:hypothetical protein LLG07_03785, partial [bacterium]|nr:hypothetical protein [bacterium]